MPGETQLRFITPSWSEIEELSMELAEEISASGFKPDIVVGVLRGGLIPAKLVADYLGVRSLATLEVKLYRGIGEPGANPVVTQPLVAPIQGQRILVIDDVADTGKTLSHVMSYISHYGPLEARSATLYIKPWSMVRPDYYAEETDAWIVFPWDKVETLRELVEKHGFGLEAAAEVVGVDPRRAAELLGLQRLDRR